MLREIREWLPLSARARALPPSTCTWQHHKVSLTERTTASCLQAVGGKARHETFAHHRAGLTAGTMEPDNCLQEMP